MKLVRIAFLIWLSGCTALFAAGKMEKSENPGQEPDTHAAELAVPGVKVVPDSFLRGWDPVTVFFDSDAGPSEGGELDDPEGIIDISPAQPGMYRWLNARTLQFRPVEAWPPLQRFTVRAGGVERDLATLMVPPSQLSPSPSRQLEPLSDFTFTFEEAVDPALLARMISFEVKELPGVGEGESLTLTERDFTIKALERTSARGNAVYLLTLASPIPYGKHAVLRLALSLDRSIPGSLAEYAYDTKSLFTIRSFGSGSAAYPVASNGSVYTKAQALSCGTGNSPLFVDFSEQLAPPSLASVKRLVSFEPEVRNFSFRVSGSRLYFSFDAERDTPYRMILHPAEIMSREGRELSFPGESSLYFYYTQLPAYLKWTQSKGLVERLRPPVFPHGRPRDGQGGSARL